MTREDYKQFKELLKGQAGAQRQHKLNVKDWHRTKVGVPAYGKGKHYLDYRAGHIFMSLVRGRTRQQIESNFDQQLTPNTKAFHGLGMAREIETRIGNLCERFGFQTDRDEDLRIVSVTHIEPVEQAQQIGA